MHSTHVPTTALAALAALTGAAALALPSAAGATAPPRMTTCDGVVVRDVHGGAVRGNTHLSEVRRGRVLTLDPRTGTTAETPFRKDSGRWVTSAGGTRYAVANQWISPAGRPGGSLQIAARTRPDGTIRCTARKLRGLRDTASATADGSLPGGGYIEVAGATTNVSGTPLVNHAVREVCVNAKLHPDGAPFSPMNPNPAPGSGASPARVPP